MQIKINNKNYTVKFGYGALRKISEFYGEKKVSGFDDLIKRFGLDKFDDPTFEQMEFVGNLIKAGIKDAEIQELDADDIIDYLMMDADGVQKVFDEFQKSMPQNVPNPEKRGN